jgi:hypothetical protein
MSDLSVPGASIVLLGAAHGINPAMGWLFAVSLGLQAGTGRAVWRALGPLALGHALAIAAAFLAAAAMGIVLPSVWLRWIAAAALLAFGVFHLRRHAHPRLGGMCVTSRELTTWSFFMASAHGAGLMLLPFVLPASTHSMATHAHADHFTMAGIAGTANASLLATLLHTASYLLVSGALAWIVYDKLGLRPWSRRSCRRINCYSRRVILIVAGVATGPRSFESNVTMSEFPSSWNELVVYAPDVIAAGFFATIGRSVIRLPAIS